LVEFFVPRGKEGDEDKGLAIVEAIAEIEACFGKADGALMANLDVMSYVRESKL
jgi:hypothetical protein